MKDKQGFDSVNTLLPPRNKPVAPENIAGRKTKNHRRPKKNWLALIMFFLILVLSLTVLYLFFEKNQAGLSNRNLIDLEEARKN